MAWDGWFDGLKLGGLGLKVLAWCLGFVHRNWKL